MACKRSAVRSRLAPPRFALRATRGAATQELEGRSVPGVALLGEDGLRGFEIVHRLFSTRATRGAATQELEGRSVPGVALLGEDGLRGFEIVHRFLGLRAAQPRKSRRAKRARRSPLGR